MSKLQRRSDNFPENLNSPTFNHTPATMGDTRMRATEPLGKAMKSPQGKTQTAADTPRKSELRV